MTTSPEVGANMMAAGEAQIAVDRSTIGEEVAPRVASGDALEAAVSRGAGDEARHAAHDARHALVAGLAHLDPDRAALRTLVAVEPAERARGHEPGAGDRRARVTGEAHRVRISVFDRAVVRRAEQFGERVVHHDRRNGVEEVRGRHGEPRATQRADGRIGEIIVARP